MQNKIKANTNVILSSEKLLLSIQAAAHTAQIYTEIADVSDPVYYSIAN